jgi:NADPH2:quinone reductase
VQYAIRIREHGGPDVLSYEAVDVPPPAAGEIQVRQEAIGVNMIDTYVASGAYSIDPLPLTPGVEGAGVVTAVGAGVAGFAVGDAVAYGGPPLGAYAQLRNLWPRYVVRRPDWLSADTAAAGMIAGLTAQMMVRRVFRVMSDTVVVVHAAAGSTGAAIAQWAAHLGAHVIGTVGTDDKVSAARANGCVEVVNYRQTNFADRVLEFTEGRGADVVYDGVGRDTFDDSFRCLTPTGMFVSYGQASGPCPPIRLDHLPVTFSNFIARPSVFSFNATRTAFEASVAEFFALLKEGVLDLAPRHRYPLADAARAHQDLLARRTCGSIILVP